MPKANAYVLPYFFQLDVCLGLSNSTSPCVYLIVYYVYNDHTALLFLTQVIIGNPSVSFTCYVLDNALVLSCFILVITPLNWPKGLRERQFS